MEAFKKLVDKKKKEQGDMEPVHAAAKGSVLHDLMSQMDGMSGDKVKGLKKVTVASNTKEGVEKGLDKAKQLLGEQKDDSHEEGYDDQDAEGPNHMPTEHEAEESEEESPEHEAMESPEEEAHEHADDEPSHEDTKAELEKVKHELESLKRSRMY